LNRGAAQSRSGAAHQVGCAALRFCARSLGWLRLAAAVLTWAVLSYWVVPSALAPADLRQAILFWAAWCVFSVAYLLILRTLLRLCRRLAGRARAAA